MAQPFGTAVGYAFKYYKDTTDALLNIEFEKVNNFMRDLKDRPSPSKKPYDSLELLDSHLCIQEINTLIRNIKKLNNFITPSLEKTFKTYDSFSKIHKEKTAYQYTSDKLTKLLIKVREHKEILQGARAHAYGQNFKAETQLCSTCCSQNIAHPAKGIVRCQECECVAFCKAHARNMHNHQKIPVCNDPKCNRLSCSKSDCMHFNDIQHAIRTENDNDDEEQNND
jgi:hypothetical protein